MNTFVFYYHCFCLEYICEICQDTRKEEEKMISPLIAKIPKVEGKGIPQWWLRPHSTGFSILRLGKFFHSLSTLQLYITTLTVMLTSIRALFVFIYLTLLTSCTYLNGNTDDVDEDSNNCSVAQNVPGITNARNKEYRGGHHKAPIHNCLKNIVSNICQNIKNLDERKMRKRNLIFHLFFIIHQMWEDLLKKYLIVSCISLGWNKS